MTQIKDGKLEIGLYTLSKGIVQAGEKPPYYPEMHVFIESGSGEAMSIDEKIFEDAVHEFFREHF